MFMLAATTASVVVFRYVSQEGFSSAARLKNSEAYQASQAGLEAVQGWLTNKGADAGELIRQYENQAIKKPVLMCVSGDCDNKNLLGGMASNREQKFKVYLAGIDVSKPTYKFKFISEGEARDGSKYSQAAIFNVDGLLKTNVKNPAIPKPQTVPPYFGGVGQGTQGTISSGYVIGDLITTSGFDTYGDLIVTGNYNMASGAQIGCPLKSNGSRYSASNENPPGNYEALANNDFFGNAYIKENLSTEMAGYCGSLYVDGNMLVKGEVKIWGDLYVKGNLTLNQKIYVRGNVTIKGNISSLKDGSYQNIEQSTFYKNLVLPNANSKYTTGTYKIDVNGTTCKITGSANPPVNGTIISHADCSSTTGAKLLDYLGDQITTSKVNSNYQSCTSGSDCIYRIPDPIVLGFAETWKQTTLPSGCTALKGFASNNVITLSSSVNTENFINAVNACHSNGTVGNWTDGNNKQWLVLRLKFDGTPNNLEDRTLGTSSGGNFIIIIEEKPSQNSIVRPPLTTENTNVLLYLPNGASNIEISRPESNKYRNYFIYSEKDIDKIDGSQYLRGNLFMAKGSKVRTMQDPTIEPNDAIFEALSNAGILKFNDKCNITKGGCGNGPSTGGDNTIFDNDSYYAPLAPHLKVVLQNQYANKENTENKIDAKPSILVLPRIIYVQQGDNTRSKAEFTKKPPDQKYYNILYLNGAEKPTNSSDITIVCSRASGNCNDEIYSGIGVFKFTVRVNNADCPNCETSFYVITTTGPSSGPVVQPSPSSSASGTSSNSSAPSSGSAPSSNSNPSGAIDCFISGTYTVETGGYLCVNIPPPTGNYQSCEQLIFKTTDNNSTVANWSIGSPHSFCNAGVARTIQLTGCNAQSPEVSGLPKTCGTIKINKPSCRLKALTTPTIASGGSITPEVLCDGTTPATGIDANSFISYDCTWTGSGTGGTLTRNSTGNCTLRLNKLICSGNLLEDMDYPCYTGTTSTNENVNVTVTGGSACAYQTDWCGGMSFDAVSTSMPATGGSSTRDRCVFLTNITGVFNIGSAKINGVDCAYMDIPNNIPSACTGYSGGTKDGGYYVYIPAYGHVTSLTATANANPTCSYTGGGTSSNSGGGALGCRYCWNSNAGAKNKDFCEYSTNENCVLITTENCPNNSSRKNCPDPLGCCNWDYPDQTKNCWRLDMNNKADCPNLMTPGQACPKQGTCPAVSTTPSSNSGGNVACDYQESWCGGAYMDQINYNTTSKPAKGTCAFFSNFTKIATTTTTAGPNKILINGEECSGSLTTCSKPASKDGGYYVYLSQGGFSTTTGNWSVTAGAMRTDCNPPNSSYVPSSNSSGTVLGCCYWRNKKTGKVDNCSTYYSGDPNACPALLTPGVACLGDNSPCPAEPEALGCCEWSDGCWLYYKDKNTPCNSNNWISSTRACAKSGGNCPVSSSSVSSSSRPSSSSTTPSGTPTITCSFSKTSFTVGENIPPPTISCSSGALDKSQANFNTTTGQVPQDYNNWKNTTGTLNAYYSILTPSSHAITVSNVTCGSTSNISGNCGTITVSPPTCSASSSATVNQTITPTVTCGSATLSTSTKPTFSGTSWNPDNNGGGVFQSSGSHALYLASVRCDDHTVSINGTDVSCGTVTVGGGGGSTCTSGQLCTNPTTISAGTTSFTCQYTNRPLKCAWTAACSASSIKVKIKGIEYTLGSWNFCNSATNNQTVASCPTGTFSIEVPSGQSIVCVNDN